MMMGHSLCRWSMEGLWSSAESGFTLILGQLGKVAAELLPNGLSPCLIVHDLQWETMACPPVICLSVGLLLIVKLVRFVWS